MWCRTSRGVRSASARAFNVCAHETREQKQARARLREVHEQVAQAMGARGSTHTRARARADKRARKRNSIKLPRV